MLGATYVKRHPRTGGYYFRRRVPDHLKPTIGTVEIIRSLATKSLDEAKRRSRTLADATDALFDEAEGREGSQETVLQAAGWQVSSSTIGWKVPQDGAVMPPLPVPQLPPQPQPIPPPPHIATMRDVFDRYLSEFDRRPRTGPAWRIWYGIQHGGAVKGTATGTRA